MDALGRKILPWLALAFVVGYAIDSANAAELWVGGNWDHVSHVDVGPPFNDDDESSVDHLGIHLEVRTIITPQSHWTFGISLGENSNWTGASIPWDDGGAAIGSRLYIEYNHKLLEF